MSEAKLMSAANWLISLSVGCLLGGLVWWVGPALISTGTVAFLFGLNTSGWMMAGWYRTSAGRAERLLTKAHEAYLAGTALPAANENASGGPYRALPEVSEPATKGDDFDEIARELRKLRHPLTVDDVEFLVSYERWLTGGATGSSPKRPTGAKTRMECWQEQVLPTLQAIVGAELFRRKRAEALVHAYTRDKLVEYLGKLKAGPALPFGKGDYMKASNAEAKEIDT